MDASVGWRAHPNPIIRESLAELDQLRGRLAAEPEGEAAEALRERIAIVQLMLGAYMLGRA